MAEPQTCTRCRRPMHTQPRTGPRPAIPDGHCWHRSRGLCEACNQAAFRDGTIADHPRALRSRDELLDEWNHLRAEGHTPYQAAARLNMTFAAFERAYLRARAAGDPRAATPLFHNTRRAS